MGRRQKQSLAVLAAGMLAAGAWSAGAKPEFAHYEIILKRRPFGEVAAAALAPVPVAAAAAPADSFIKNLRLCAITETPAGLRVGISDLASKPPRSYFLYVGDSEDGVELVQADYAGEKALLRKGAEEYWISMGAEGGGTSVQSTVTTVAAVANAAAGRRMTYAERIRKRREEEEARMRELAARPKVSPEELEKSLQNFQMDVIRRGEPPLPIPLTPEMDDQLVKEGVLPPLEEGVEPQAVPAQ